MIGGAGRPDAQLFPGLLAAFATKLVWADRDEAGQVEAEMRLALPNRLALFHDSVGGAWPAACSLWAQIYFNTLLIPAICLVRRDQECTRGVASIAGEFCPISGTPLCFRVSPDDPKWREGPFTIDLIAAVDRHIGHLIEGVHRIGRLSRLMLWESARRTSAWTVDQIALADQVGASRAAASMAGTGLIPGPSPNRPGGKPAVRRFCCLRHQVPGCGECPAICPRGRRRR